MNKSIDLKDGKYYFNGEPMKVGKFIGGYRQLKYKLIKLAQQLDDKGRQYIPKLNDKGFYY